MTLLPTLRSQTVMTMEERSRLVLESGANWGTKAVHPHQATSAADQCNGDSGLMATIIAGLPKECTGPGTGAGDLSHRGGEDGAVSSKRSTAT